jgi:hypothetical protein
MDIDDAPAALLRGVRESMRLVLDQLDGQDHTRLPQFGPHADAKRATSLSHRAGQRQYPSAAHRSRPSLAPARMSWARLLQNRRELFERRTPAPKAKAKEGFRKRVFEIDMEQCSHDQGPEQSPIPVRDFADGRGRTNNTYL